MTIAEFKKIAQVLKKTYIELETEAIRVGISPLSNEYSQLQTKARQKVLANAGFGGVFGNKRRVQRAWLYPWYEAG